MQFERVALRATMAAALACQGWIGRGDGKAADGAATDALRDVLAASPGLGTVVVGEGAKDEAPMLYDGEQLGQGGLEFDIAVDPLECTTLCSKGLPGSLVTLAFAARGAMATLGQSFYMDKLVVAGPAAEALDITRDPEDNVRSVAEALGRGVEDICVSVLDKPRHEELIARIHTAGARVVTPPDGDVAGSLDALLPDGGADLLMGVGGTPEGVLTACAARALGGGMQARLAPRGDEEARALADAGLDTDKVYGLEDLVDGESFFVATGVTGGELLRRPWVSEGQVCTESIVVADGRVRREVETAAPSSDAPGPDVGAT
ncbi:MAG: fructose-bisphosphatase class II family protein [Solirubrobacteraceae bacterium]